MIENYITKIRTVEEVSEPILGIKPIRTYELIRKGIIPPGVVVRFGKRQIRINEQKLLEWIEKGGFTCTGK